MAKNNMGKVNLVATNGAKIKIDATQKANVQASQAYMSMINMLMDSDANTDVKLDALSSVCQAVKNDGNFAQSPETSAANVQLENRNVNNISNIQKLNQDLKLAVATCAVNTVEGINAVADGNGSEIDFKLNQAADAISDSLVQMITDEESTLSEDQKNQMKSDIEADNKAEGTGIVSGIGKEVGSTAREISGDVAETAQKISGDVSSTVSSGMTMMILAVAVPIVLIILTVVFIVIYKMMKGDDKGGRDDYSYDEGYGDDYGDEGYDEGYEEQ